MKLLQRTLIYFLVISAPTFILGCTAFYYFLQYTIIRQIDESLSQDKQDIIDFVNNNKNDVTELYKAINCTYYLKPAIDTSQQTDKYSFGYEYDSVEMDMQPYRELKTTILIKQNNYELTMRASFVDSDSLIYSILFFAIVLLGLLTVGIALMNWRISKRIWNPFYRVLALISAYQPGKVNAVAIDSNNIEEFRILIKAILRMIRRIDKDFNQQKKFIDNIAHELQTPIAIASSQLEVFMQKASLNKETAEMIYNIDSTLLKLKNINKSLLLLSRIHNEQFIQKKHISINTIIKDYFATHNEQIAVLQISLHLHLSAQLSAQMNESLANVLVNNLLNNAIRHNYAQGTVSVSTTENQLIIENTGDELDITTEQLFKTYTKGHKSEDSLGIGLSIVKEICNTYNLKIEYTNVKNNHCVTVLFHQQKHL